MSAGDEDVAKEHPYLIEAESGNKLPPDAVKPLLEPRLVTPDAASIGDMNPRKGGDGDEANESNNGAAIGSTAPPSETETDVVEDIVAAATNDTTVDAAPNAEKR
jgi:hypothetical protein